MWREKKMVRIFLNARLSMNMVIMHLNVLREKGGLRVDSNLEDIEIDYMLMNKKKMNLIKT